jgi:hypothetical protein
MCVAPQRYNLSQIPRDYPAIPVDLKSVLRVKLGIHNATEGVVGRGFNRDKSWRVSAIPLAVPFPQAFTITPRM